MVVYQNYWLPIHRHATATGSQTVPAPGYLLSNPGLADAISFPRWYARTAGSLLREISFQKENISLAWSVTIYMKYTAIQQKRNF
jgi:hypothetical protein